VAAEACVLGGALSLFGLALVSTPGLLRPTGVAPPPVFMVPPPAAAAPRELPAPPDPGIAAEPVGTFLGMADDLLLERIRTAPIVRMKLNHGGSSLSFRVDFADGSRAAFKPAQTNLQTIPRKEVAAYRLNRLLGLNAVPPAAPRLVGREELFAALEPGTSAALARIRAETLFNPDGKTAGAFSYWVPRIEDSGLDAPSAVQEWIRWLGQAQALAPERSGLAAQLSSLVVFDFLIANPDRFSGGNMKRSAGGGRLFYMDNTLAFFLDPNGPGRVRSLLQRTQRFSRRLVEALDRLDAPALERSFAASGVAAHEILTPAELRAVLARRDVVRRHVDELIAVYGADKVLVFP
jgi:hypothetical protein